MGTIVSDLRDTFRRGNITLQLVFINVAVFFVCTLAQVLAVLCNGSLGGLLEWFELPASTMRLLMQPWSLFSYMFLHADVLHLLFNMLWLYWFGQIFLLFFSARHLRGLYVLGGVCGGLLYWLAYNVFPYFAPMRDFSFMVGASASVLGIVAATAYRQPNYPIRLMLFGVVRLKYLALIVIGSDLLFITSANAGGHIAHLGGALAGLWFASSLSKGSDVTRWLNAMIDGLGSLFGRLFDAKRHKPRMKAKAGGAQSNWSAAAGRRKDYDFNARRKAQNDEIDRILDKLKKSGYDSLSSDEKKTLFDASKRG